MSEITGNPKYSLTVAFSPVIFNNISESMIHNLKYSMKIIH
jgi:hypothetical protein